MTQAVLDASVIIKWYRTKGEADLSAARILRSAFESGVLQVFAPGLLFLEILNNAGRRWRLERTDLLALARALDRLPFSMQDPPLASVAEWTARGLTAYDSAYVALAEQHEVPLITEDALILSIAPAIARPLSQL